MSRTYSHYSSSRPQSAPGSGVLVICILVIIWTVFFFPDGSRSQQGCSGTPTSGVVTVDDTMIMYQVCGSRITSSLPSSSSYCSATVNAQKDEVDCTNPNALRLVNKLAILPFSSVVVEGTRVEVTVPGRINAQDEINFRNSVVLAYNKA